MQPFERAQKHPIILNKPAVNFFEGALLGNGGLGINVTTRPDGVVLHFGHNSVWDIRVAENNADIIGTFAEIFEKVKAISPDLAAMEDDPWYKKYIEMTGENYRAPYPRPFPCGSLLLGLDRRVAEIVGHRLDISCGLCEVQIKLHESEADIYLQIFTEMDCDRVWLRTVDASGQPVAAPFERIRVLPDPSTPPEMPAFTTAGEGQIIAFTQVLPFSEPQHYDTAVGHPKDRAFRLTVRVNANVGIWKPQTSYGVPRPVDPLERSLTSAGEFVACVQLDEGLASDVKARPLNVLSDDLWANASERSFVLWKAYWDKSGVVLDDELLERVWYWNMHLFNCAVKPEAMCPGLFANWNYRDIGTAWHGDYHMNYNTQQPFWLSFSSNHIDKHLAT